MNTSELLISLHINVLHPLKLIAKKNNLSMQQVLCIYSIPLEGITQNSLAELLSVDVSTLSRNLNKLELQNIIIKRSVKGDDRFFKICLSDYGIDLFNRILYDFTCYIKNLNLDTESNDSQHIIDSLLKLNWHILKNKTQDV